MPPKHDRFGAYGRIAANSQRCCLIRRCVPDARARRPFVRPARAAVGRNAPRRERMRWVWITDRAAAKDCPRRRSGRRSRACMRLAALATAPRAAPVGFPGRASMQSVWRGLHAVVPAYDRAASLRWPRIDPLADQQGRVPSCRRRLRIAPATTGATGTQAQRCRFGTDIRADREPGAFASGVAGMRLDAASANRFSRMTSGAGRRAHYPLRSNHVHG